MASIFRGPLFTRYQRYAALTSLAAVLACPSPNLLANTLKLAAGTPFSQKTWENPQIKRRAVDLLTHADPSEFWILKDTFFRGPGQPLSYDWPNPILKVTRFAVENRSEVDPSEFWLLKDAIYGGPGQVPSYDWPNPRGPQRSVDLLIEADSTEYWLLAPAVVPAPFATTDWPNPTRVPRALQPSHVRPAGQPSAVVVDATPPVSEAQDWPNPRTPQRSIDLVTIADGSEFWLLKDQFFGAVGQVQAVQWQNPLVAGRAHTGFVAPSSQQTILAPIVVAVPFAQDEWPNPTLRVRQAVTNLSSIFYYIIDDNNPPATVVWPNPTLRSFPLDNRTIADGTEYWLLAPVATTKPFNLTDWPNPRIATVPLEGRTITDASEFWFLKDTFFGGAGQPPTYLAQPNPRIATVPTDARTWTFTLPITVLGAIQPTPANLTDWPNPRGYRHVISLRTHAEFTRLLGKDKIFGGPGQPITIWPQPNPLGYRYPTDLRTGFARQTLTTAIAALDPACIIHVYAEWWVVRVRAEDRRLNISTDPFRVDPEDD